MGTKQRSRITIWALCIFLRAVPCPSQLLDRISDTRRHPITHLEDQGSGRAQRFVHNSRIREPHASGRYKSHGPPCCRRHRLWCLDDHLQGAGRRKLHILTHQRQRAVQGHRHHHSVTVTAHLLGRQPGLIGDRHPKRSWCRSHMGCADADELPLDPHDARNEPAAGDGHAGEA
eukprot:scaffold18898_cov116-Isochrysis_galbana.AAC.3